MSTSGSMNPSSTANNPQILTEKKKARNEIENLMARMNLKAGEVVIPKRKSPGTAGRKVQIDTNFYQVKLEDKWVFRYDVTVTGRSKRGKDVDLTKRSESTAVIAERIDVCRSVFRIILDTHQHVFNNTLVYYDLQSILFTLQPIDFPPNKSRIELIVDNYEQELPGNLDSVTFEIKQVKESAQKMKLNDLESLIEVDTMKRDRSVLNFIELSVNQYPMFSEREFLTLKGSTAFFMDGATHDLPEKNLDRGGSKYLASGVQKSAALIEGFKREDADPNQRVVGFMLEAKHSPFHSVLDLLDAIKQHDGTSSLYYSFVKGQCNEPDLKRISRCFTKLFFNVFYPGQYTPSKRIELKRFDSSTANTNFIETVNKTVAKYFEEKYAPLQYPNAHLVTVKQGSQWNFYPPELLRVADNQVVTVEQMDAPSKAAMIRVCLLVKTKNSRFEIEECAIRPDIMRKENENAATAIHLRDSKHSLEAGIKFSKATLSVNSRALAPPQMRYADKLSNIMYGEAAWRPTRFIQPFCGSKNFTLYQLRTEDSRPTFSKAELEGFALQITEQSIRMGMDLGRCVDSGTYYESQVVECVKYCANTQIPLCLFVSPENIKRQHAVMKMCEHRYNIVTQDVKCGTVRKIMNRGTATLENYVAKTNMKLGGLNYSVEDRTPETQCVLENALFVGINTNQPGSKTVVDRVTSIKNEKPGVLGFAANMGENYNTFFGDFIYTVAYRSEFYSQLRPIFSRCVSTFANKRGKMPDGIVFYYTGLSEGQFENAYQLAIPLIKQGIRDANDEQDIPLTLLAVQKMNNVRLFPKTYPQSSNSKDYQYNVVCGTTVDTTIVHPVFTEFYQMAHSALKGTGRVPRYTVLLDENDFSMDLLEGVTNALAYEHQIVSRATSLPTPVFVAEGYAQRGRDVYNAAHGANQCYEVDIKPLPRTANGEIDFIELSKQLNYENTQLEFQRVNA